MRVTVGSNNESHSALAILFLLLLLIVASTTSSQFTHNKVSVMADEGDNDEDNEHEEEVRTVKMINKDFCNACHVDVYIAVKDMATLSCSSCHFGDPGSKDVSKAHEGLITNPVAPDVRQKTCGQCHTLVEGDLWKFLTGSVKMHPYLGVIEGIKTLGGSRGCVTCHDNMTISITGMKEIPCSTCHGGNPDAGTLSEAHSDLIVNPKAPSIANKTCGQCHEPAIYNLPIRIHPPTTVRGQVTQSPQATTISTTPGNETQIIPKIDGNIFEGEYSSLVDFEKIKVYYRVLNDTIYFALVGRTTGWVAIGFSPSEGMEDADIVIGYVASGGAHVIDSYSGGKYGPHRPDTALGGKDDILEYFGTEKGGLTVIEFSRKLVTGDSYDKPLHSGTVRIIWAVGENDDPKSIHTDRGKGIIQIRPEISKESSLLTESKTQTITKSAEIKRNTTTSTPSREGKPAVSRGSVTRATTETSQPLHSPSQSPDNTVETYPTQGNAVNRLLQLLILPLLAVVAMVVLSMLASRKPDLI